METITARTSLVKQGGVTLICAALAVICGVIIAEGRFRSDMETVKVWFGLVGMTAITLFMMFRMADRAPRVIIDAYGIHNPKLWLQPIPWSRIKAVRYVSGYKKQPRISFIAMPPEDVLDTRPGWQNWFKDASLKLSHPLYVDLGGLDHGAKALVEAVMARLPHLVLERK